MEKKSRGAPSKPPELRRESMLVIRLTAAELKAVEAAADGKASTWARDVILRATKRKLK